MAILEQPWHGVIGMQCALGQIVRIEDESRIRGSHTPLLLRDLTHGGVLTSASCAMVYPFRSRYSR